ncbi:carboxy terminal-processing peptidase [Tundrisphaera lichenicola]|uniref:carboxy terminal-processing peptidase n=1 Tax=Tundrisphaera lichenicola TaxID=2029860 RepID=UPI003EBE52C4
MPRSVLRPMAAFGLLGVVALFVGAQAPAPVPTPEDEKTAKIVVGLLERSHMAKPKIDDDTAIKWCKTFLKDLDPQKYYFLKSDAEEFLPQATTLDDKIREGNLDFAKLVFDRFLKRSDERLAMVQELLKIKPDFNIDESMTDDPEALDYPKNEDEARERMRQRIKLELLQAKVDGENEDDAIKKLASKYRDRNRMVHQFNASDLLEFYLSSLSRTFDPHTTYMSKDSLEDLIQQSLQLSLTGIGASLQSEDGFAVIKELIPGGPAEKDGTLQPEDKILGIKNDDGTERDFVEQRLRDVVRYIRGDAGTHVKLIIQSQDSKDKKVVELVRAKVELSESHAKGQVIESKVDDKTLKIGVISLPAFYGDTQAVLKGEADAVSCTNDCRKLIEGFKEQGVDAVMMDLRGNGGGLLNEAISLSGLFIDKGPVVQVREASGVTVLPDDEAGTAWDGPFVLLIDRQSASASEIFAGVIKDYGRGLIIGDSSTFGKGTVQSIMPISERFASRAKVPSMGALKLTIQQFYRVNGDSTQIRGVEPDIHIPSIFDQADFGEGKMDNALKFDHVADRPHDMYNRVPADLVTRLVALSEKRRSENEKFQKREAAIQKIIERKARHAISLNEVKFRAETVSEDETKDEAKAKTKGTRKKASEAKAWEPNFYNDEVLNIVGDYLSLGRKVLAAAPVRAEANN